MLMSFIAHIRNLFVKDLGKIETKFKALVGDAEALEASYVAQIKSYTDQITVANAKIEAIKLEQEALAKLKAAVAGI